MNCRIFPIGDSAVTIDFGNEISGALNRRALALADHLERRRFKGLIETVPAYASLTVFYDLSEVRKNFPAFSTGFEAVKECLAAALAGLDESSPQANRQISVPVCFERDYAPDLEFVAAKNNLTSDRTLEIFLGETYRVYMLGFLPGFAYMGEVDERIATPRKTSPRLKVPRGSVGIAGRQTGIYSHESPGGWQIIGRTPLALFTPERETPTLLEAGDSVDFYPIDRKTFVEMEESVFNSE